MRRGALAKILFEHTVAESAAKRGVAVVEESNDRFDHGTGKDDYTTPPEVIDFVRERLGGRIDLDAAALAHTSKSDSGLYLGPDHEDPAMRDARSVSWKLPGVSTVWNNPPYSRAGGGLEMWCEAMHRASRDDENGPGLAVAATFYGRTETLAFRRWVWRADEVWFVVGRLYFRDPVTGDFVRSSKTGGKTPAPAGSVIAIWRPHYDGPPRFGLWSPKVGIVEGLR